MSDCRACGHSRKAHEHYRDGTDCSLCYYCPAYRTSWWRRLIR